MNKLLSFIMLLCSASLFVSAKETSDTLRTNMGDRVIVKYDVTQGEQGEVTVAITGFERKLSSFNRDKYEAKDVVGLFFDRVGENFEYRFTGDLTASAVSVPSDYVSYDGSESGFCVLTHADLPRTLTMRLKEGNCPGDIMTIPLYLACYHKKKKIVGIETKGKDEYELFAQCNGGLHIRLPKTKPAVRNGDDTTPGTAAQTITITGEEDSELGDAENKALRMASEVERLTASMVSLPVDEELENLVRELQSERFSITDDAVRKRVEQVLDDYKETIINLPEPVNQDTELLKRKAKELIDKVENLLEEQDEIPFSKELTTAYKELQKLKPDVIDANLTGLAQRIEDVNNSYREKENEIKQNKEKKRNLWLIIGGVILALLGFGGSQYLQHRRNAQNNLSMEKMQNDIAKRAENEARRRTQGMMRSKISQAEGTAMRKSRNMVHNGISNALKGKGKKGLSI